MITITLAAIGYGAIWEITMEQGIPAQLLWIIWLNCILTPIYLLVILVKF